jgi:hypothetical protein
MMNMAAICTEEETKINSQIKGKPVNENSRLGVKVGA